MIGAISGGTLCMPSDDYWKTLFAPWLTPYCICLGGFTLAIFAMLAATYLTVDATGNDALQKSFRTRALISHGFVGAFAIASVLFAAQGNAWVYTRLLTLPIALGAGGLFIVCFIAAVVTLWLKQYKWARVLAASEAFSVLLGYALAQFPYLIPPRLTIYNSAAPVHVLHFLLGALAIGAVLLFPSLFLLFHLFKGKGKHSTQGS
jgi:cytochrome d ubiquinol oxidase subunit II